MLRVAYGVTTKKVPALEPQSTMTLKCTFNATDPRKASSKLELGYGFAHPEGFDKNKYFTGNFPFGVDELEVFRGEF